MFRTYFVDVCNNLLSHEIINKYLSTIKHYIIINKLKKYIINRYSLTLRIVFTIKHVACFT